MSKGIQFTSYIPTSLVGVNSPSPTLAAEVVTGLPIPTGAFPGNVFFLSETQANQLSLVSINAAPLLTCHEGWYAVVQVSASAVASNIKQGAIGAMTAIPTTSAQETANTPYSCVVTDGATAATAGLLGVNPVVFLGSVTAGYYTIVQVSGDASILLAASQTTVVGQGLLSQTPGTVLSATTALSLANIQNLVGVSENVIITPAGALTLSAAAAASAGSTVYTGTITGGGTNNYVGLYFVITGFTNATNNSAYAGAQGFLCTANTTTTLTLTSTGGIAETHAGTATATNLARARVAFPFGIV